MGAGSSATVKVYMTNDSSAGIDASSIDTDLAADATWNDVTQDIAGVGSISCLAGAIQSESWFLDTAIVCEYLMVYVDYTDSADSTIEIKAKLTT